MSKGLKELVEAAMGVETPAPVNVSGEAHAALAAKMREWSGWSNARFVLGDPRSKGLESPWAGTFHPPVSEFMINVDTLILNPHRVLLTVTPFRLRQEAVLTGAMLHEAGHARHSLWQPGRYGNPYPLLHGDGTTVSNSALALARLMEEPRVEGLTARDADNIGADGLGWTLRASAAHLMPPTALSAEADQKILDVIKSWALRAGRQIAFARNVADFEVRRWVTDYNALLHSALVDHITAKGDAGDPDYAAQSVKSLLISMITCTDDRGTTMVDKARAVLALLFPETDPEDQPEAGGGCSVPMPSDEGDESEESEDEGASPSTDDEGESDEGESDEGESDEDADEEPGTGDESDDEDSEGDEGQPEDSESDESEPEDSESDESEPEGDTDTDTDTDTDSDLAEALAEMEATAGTQMEDEVDEASEEAEDEASKGAGAGESGSGDKGWRNPTREERMVQSNAGRFLRNLIEPSEASKVFLSDTPSATIDGAAMAAWKAGGQIRDPRFFQRTQRTSQPSPPVKIAVLVDVSASMDVLQKPSALLSWALAAAALDLRNFAGRGVQVESTLIHWGWDVSVIAKNGETLPGIKEFDCNQGTSHMRQALEEVENQMPGFFDVSPTPVNRLLVQFTDWELSGCRPGSDSDRDPTSMLARAMAAGVNMLSVVPAGFGRGYNARYESLSSIMRAIPVKRGRNEVLHYDPRRPEQVWDKAAEVLGI